MNFKKIIALFCLLTLSTQMLPVKAIGAVLFGNQINEEIPHSIDLGKDSHCKQLLKDDYLLNTIAGNDLISGNINEYVHFASLLPSNHTGEVHTPPPNID
jgi:hypothetical protein